MNALAAQKLRLEAIAGAEAEAKRLMEVTIMPGIEAAAKEARAAVRLHKNTSSDPAVQEAIRLQLHALGYTCTEPDSNEADDGTFLFVRWH